VVFAKIDTDKASDVAQSLGIKSLPTFKFFKGGEQVDEMIGWRGAPALAETLVKHGATAAASDLADKSQ
jgi:thioredoxin 1